MRAAIAFVLIAVVAIVAFNRALGPSADVDTPVFVHDADPIKVLLPANPDAEIISGYVYSALAGAAREENGSLERHLSAMSTDASLLDWIARSGAARFSSGDAAALAYPLYRATVAEDRVDITTATIELLPAYWAIGNSIAHEDGHALINEMLATECGPSIVVDHGTAGARGSSLERAIETSLYDLGNEAHERYHEVVNGSRSPRYTPAARNAVAAVIEAGC